MFYESRKRKAAAEAKKAEADNITQYADEWKELYEKKEKRVGELDTKIDTLYAKIEEVLLIFGNVINMDVQIESHPVSFRQV